MNNLLDYSHMINTYVMCVDFPINICHCDKFINCYRVSDLKNCKYYNLIIKNLPLFNIFINPNIKRQFKLPNTWNNSILNINDFFKLMFFIISFMDESTEYISDKPYIKCVVILSLYTLIINNYNIITNILYVFETFIINMNNKLKNNYLSINNNSKLNSIFNRYFIDSSFECISIMYKCIDMLDELT